MEHGLSTLGSTCTIGRTERELNKSTPGWVLSPPQGPRNAVCVPVSNGVDYSRCSNHEETSYRRHTLQLTTGLGERALQAEPALSVTPILGYFGTLIRMVDTMSCTSPSIPFGLRCNELQHEAQNSRQAIPSCQVMLTSGEYMGC